VASRLADGADMQDKRWRGSYGELVLRQETNGSNLDPRDARAQKRTLSIAVPTDGRFSPRIIWKPRQYQARVGFTRIDKNR
jgi:hypothetical protein